MILFKKWAKDKVKSYIYCVNQFLHEKRHKKWNQECKQKQSRMFNFCNIFDLLTSRTQKIACWPPVFKPGFYIFLYNEQLMKIQRNFMGKFHCIILYIFKINQRCLAICLHWQRSDENWVMDSFQQLSMESRDIVGTFSLLLKCCSHNQQWSVSIRLSMLEKRNIKNIFRTSEYFKE